MLLSKAELQGTYYKKALNMDDADTYLQRANAYCIGIIGGEPVTVDETIKTAVALAFEIFAEGETSEVDQETGNVTETAPTGPYVRRKEKDPLDDVIKMLQPAKRAFEAANAAKTDRGIMFL